MDQTLQPKPALWLRLLQFPITRLILLGGVLFFMMGLSNAFMKQFSATPLIAAAAATAMAALALAVYVSFARFIERRPVSELAVSGMGRELVVGMLIGAGLYALCVLILIVPGIYRIKGLNPWYFVLPAVAMALNAGIFEELLFRGVLFRIVQEWFGSWISLVVSSLVFGLMHLLKHWREPDGGHPNASDTPCKRGPRPWDRGACSFGRDAGSHGQLRHAGS